MTGPGAVTRAKRRRCDDTANFSSSSRCNGSLTTGSAHLDCSPLGFAPPDAVLSEKTGNSGKHGAHGDPADASVSCSPSTNRTSLFDASSSTGFVQPAEVMRCSEPSTAAASSKTGEATPFARTMRCTPPTRSMKNHSPAACSSTTQCHGLNSGESTLPARVMRIALPARHGKAARCSPLNLPQLPCPDGVMQCNATAPHCPSTAEAAFDSLSAPGTESSTLPNQRCEPFKPSVMTHSVGPKPLKNLSQQIKTSNVCTKNVVVEDAEPDTLNCRLGQSSYSLRALKTVPLYSENVVGITYKPVKHGSRQDHVIVTNNNNTDDDDDDDFEEEAHSFKTDYDNSSLINLLPNEVLSKIFSHLSHIDLLRSCSRVCQRWLSVAMSPNLWQTLSFSGQATPIATVCGCIRLSPLLKSISIKDRYDIDEILPVLHQNCKRLETLNLVRCRPCDATKRNLKAKSLYPFLGKSQLRNLNLKGTDYRSRKFYQMLSALPNFRKLNISCSKGVTPHILREIAKNSNLKVFKNKWHSHAVYHGPKSMTIQLPGKIDDWVNAYSLLFQNAGGNLTTLEFYAAGISDAALSGLVHCKKLKKLSIYNANCFASESMTAVSSLPELHELLIHNAKLRTTDVSNAFQTRNLSGLRCLHLNDSVTANSTEDVLADNCLETVARRCPHLHHLSFTKCSTVSDAGVQAVLSNCPNLQSLDLYGAFGVFGKSFLLIPKCTPHLKLIVIEEDCSEEKSEIVKSLTENHGISVHSVSTWKHRSTSYLV